MGQKKSGQRSSLPTPTSPRVPTEIPPRHRGSMAGYILGPANPYAMTLWMSMLPFGTVLHIFNMRYLPELVVEISLHISTRML